MSPYDRWKLQNPEDDAFLDSMPHEACTVTDDDLDSVAEPEEVFAVGDKVRIVTGPPKGMIGEVYRVVQCAEGDFSYDVCFARDAQGNPDDEDRFGGYELELAD